MKLYTLQKNDKRGVTTLIRRVAKDTGIKNVWKIIEEDGWYFEEVMIKEDN